MSKEPIVRILIIEDDPDGRRSVAEAMEEAGYTAVNAAADYEAAAELANCAAGVVVGKLGTATCTDRELLDYIDRLTRTGLKIRER